MLDIHPSARKHGLDDADIRHAVEQAIVVARQHDDVDRLLCLGADRTGRFLEVVVATRPGAPDLVLHAMAMRLKYVRLLRGIGGDDA